MKLQRREKILVGVTLGLVGLAALYFLLFAGDSRSDDQLADDQAKLTTEVKDKQKLLQAAARDSKRLADWRQRALPPEPALARSLYQNWLGSLAARVNFRDSKLSSTETGSRRDQFTRISFTLKGQAKLADLVQFLHEFYSAGYLHQIRKLNVKPIKGSRDLSIDLTIEALSLPTADNKDRLTKEAGHALQLAKLADYRDPITARDFFAPYVRPAPSYTPPPPRPKKAIDPGDFAHVTGFTDVDGALQVWIQDRMGDKQWKLGAGETFAIGSVKGTVQSIQPEGAAIIEFDGHRRLLHIGDALHEGVEIPDEPAGQVKQRNNSTGASTDRDN